MSFSTVINLGTVSAAITQVKLYECTGNNTGCTGLTGYSAVDVNTFPITVSGIDDNSNYIKIEALGTCADTIQSLVISGKPGTPTPTPTTTPTPTPTATTTSTSLTFTATVDKLQYGEQPPNNVVKVTVTTNISAMGTFIWWGKHAGTAGMDEFINYDSAMEIQSATGHTFELVIDDDETTETDQTFAVAIFTGSTTTKGGQVAYTSTFTILDDSITAQYRYILLEAFLDSNGCSIPYSVNNFNFYWDQEASFQLDGSDVLSGASYCYKFVSPTNDLNDLAGKSLISDASLNNCPDNCSGG